MMDHDANRRWMKPRIDRVPKPEGGNLAASGERVTWDSFWQRRAMDGDIEPMSQAEIDAAIAAEADEADAPKSPSSGGKK